MRRALDQWQGMIWGTLAALFGLLLFPSCKPTGEHAAQPSQPGAAGHASPTGAASRLELCCTSTTDAHAFEGCEPIEGTESWNACIKANKIALECTGGTCAGTSCECPNSPGLPGDEGTTPGDPS